MVKQEYAYLAENKSGLCGMQYFEGFCVDLAELLAQKLEFDYEICLVEDDKIGTKQPDGTWDGLIGELIRHVRIFDF